MEDEKTIDEITLAEGCIRLIKKTLSDKSLVYNITFWNDISLLVFTIACESKIGANRIFAMIRKHAV